MDDHNAPARTFDAANRIGVLPNSFIVRDERHRRRLIFAWTLPFLKAHDLASLCLTSRDLCMHIRADLFRRVVLKTHGAADAFCRTIQEDPLVSPDKLADAVSDGDVQEEGSPVPSSERKAVKVLGWHVQTLELSFKLDSTFILHLLVALLMDDCL